MNPRTEPILEGAQMVATRLVREPVRQAVTDALREEGVVVDRATPAPDTQGGDGRRGSKLLLVAVALAAVGAIYYLRRWDGRRTTDAEIDVSGKRDDDAGRQRDHDGPTGGSDDRAEDLDGATDDVRTGESSKRDAADRTGGTSTVEPGGS